MTRYVFVTGGVMSGIGKGIATASLGRLLKSKGFRVTAIKIDPYLNVDAGTMNPVEHGEVFVTKDGLECDQDMGNYERFLDEDVTRLNYMTTGQVYETVINRERNLGYHGRCVEVVPDIPNEIIGRIKKAASAAKADFCLIEIGGTVGEYQNSLFLEAARMMHLQNPESVLFVLVSYLPIPKNVGEMKTKPTQTAARTLNAAGIQPNIIIARSHAPLDEPRKQKISTFCNVAVEDIISAPDSNHIYRIPLNLEQDGFADRVLKAFGKKAKKKDMREWKNFVQRMIKAEKPLKIGIVGKYFETGEFTLMDSYISVIEAIKHAAWHAHRKPEIHWLSAQRYEMEKKHLNELRKYDGIIVPGAFGKRGAEGKIRAIEYCRKRNVPYLGLCFGLQLAVVEFARNVAGITDATSREFHAQETKPLVIDVMEEQRELLKNKEYGGTMRLGDYTCRLHPGTKAFKAYGNTGKKAVAIKERHRHRYEVNNEYRDLLQEHGLVFSGINPQKNLVEIIELPDHPFFVATQFHPELKSRPLRPHPLFVGFVKAAIAKREPRSRS